jgi:hypothetical protein
MNCSLIRSITFEPADVMDYDVSLADGSLASVANNQLILVNADGSNRRVLVDGGPKENNFWVTSPVFSPDGHTLTYSYKGLNLFDIPTGITNFGIADQYGDLLPNGLPFPLET